ncbi:MAG: hypothetical protein SWH54_09140 [Thermodesulfobacteriota bacterium]|nr:hypothetical protein [Thermodesulfobacteriota bacterium]
METHEKTAASKKKIGLLSCIAFKEKYIAHAKKKIKDGPRITYATQLFGKGVNANARHPQNAIRWSKSSFDNRYKGMIDRIRKVSEISLAANIQSGIIK